MIVSDNIYEQIKSSTSLVASIVSINGKVIEDNENLFEDMSNLLGNSPYLQGHSHRVNEIMSASQQKSGMDKMRLKMKRIVEKKLGYTWWRRDCPDTPIQDLWHIPKPPYMRYEKYERLLGEFRQLQKDYERAFWMGLAKISYSRDIAEAAMRHINSL